MPHHCSIVTYDHDHESTLYVQDVDVIVLDQDPIVNNNMIQIITHRDRSSVSKLAPISLAYCLLIVAAQMLMISELMTGSIYML